jgi:hypothetical protein
MYMNHIEKQLTLLIVIHFLFTFLTMILMPYRSYWMNVFKIGSDIILVLFLFTYREIVF